MNRVRQSTIGPPGMPPTSSRVSPGRVPTTRLAPRRCKSKPAANTHGNRTAMRADIVPGAAFPDYELPDHTSTMRRLSEVQGEDPMIVTLARGHYCPKEHQQHLELAAFYPKIAVGYTQIATIATDAHHTLQEFRASVGAQWPFLSDPERIVQKDLDIQEYTDRDNDPMIPHTLVLKPGLIVHRIYNGYWFWGRPSVVDLWHDLRDVTRETRPDWDLSTPGLRERWEAGDLAPFHGWDKRAEPERCLTCDLDSRRCRCISSRVCACGTFTRPASGTSSCSASRRSSPTPRRRC